MLKVHSSSHSLDMSLVALCSIVGPRQQHLPLEKIQEKLLDAKITEAYQHPDKHSENDRLILFSKPLIVRLKTRYATKVKWLSLHTTCPHAPDAQDDKPPLTTRHVCDMFRPLASIMRHITTTPVPPSSTTTPPKHP